MIVTAGLKFPKLFNIFFTTQYIITIDLQFVSVLDEYFGLSCWTSPQTLSGECHLHGCIYFSTQYMKYKRVVALTNQYKRLCALNFT